jgi:hypothetical protein
MQKGLHVSGHHPIDIRAAPHCAKIGKFWFLLTVEFT